MRAPITRARMEALLIGPVMSMLAWFLERALLRTTAAKLEGRE